MAKEIRIDHDRLSDPNTVTKVMSDEFKKHGLDTRVNIAEKLEDDPSTRQRVVKIKNTKYFGPWSHRG